MSSDLVILSLRSSKIYLLYDNRPRRHGHKTPEDMRNMMAWEQGRFRQSAKGRSSL